MALSPFVWGNNGEMLTPDQVDRIRMSSALAAQRGASTAPVGGIAEGLARLVDAWGGYRGNIRADREEQEGQAEASSVIAALMGQGAPAMLPQPQAPVDAGGVPDVYVGQQSAAMPVNPEVSGAFSGRSDLSSLPPSLIQSESGGNWSALNSEGYGGRGQFGAARLADAARAGVIPAGMTGADYSRQPPEVQQRVEQWHRGDIMKDLGQYVGVDVDGAGPIPPLTEDSILAVAHLGGTGGAQKFIESGGRYNPSDSNGTSLSDYAMQHSGASPVVPIGGSAGVSPVVQALMQAQANPWVAKQYGPVLNALMGQEFSRQQAIQDQQMRQADPMYQAQLQQAQLQLEQMRNPAPEQQPLINAGGGSIYNPNTGEWINAPRGAVAVDPMSAIGKLEADRRAGLISEDQYQAELARMAPKGMSIESDGQGGIRFVQGAGVGGDNTKPFTEAQSKDNVYSTRAEGALEILDPIAGALTDRSDILADKVPMGLARGMQGRDYQLARQAGQEFLQAILRKDTGAAITPQEESLYGQVYLPQPGDTEEVMQQKAQSRRRALEAIKSGMSPSQMVATERALQATGGQAPAEAGKRLRFNPETGELE